MRSHVKKKLHQFSVTSKTKCGEVNAAQGHWVGGKSDVTEHVYKCSQYGALGTKSKQVKKRPLANPRVVHYYDGHIDTTTCGTEPTPGGACSANMKNVTCYVCKH